MYILAPVTVTLSLGHGKTLSRVNDWGIWKFECEWVGMRFNAHSVLTPQRLKMKSKKKRKSELSTVNRIVSSTSFAWKMAHSIYEMN